jgi:hypothetical protein
MTRIYKITDRTNNKIYIGQTKRDIYKRFGEHLSRVTSNRKNDRACSLYIAMSNHGRENFYVELVEEVEDNVADQREKYWIKEFDSINPDKGYNLDCGGRIISEVCRKAQIALQIGKPVSERVAKLNKERGMKMAKTICQYSKNGEFISEFPSIIEASRQTGCDRRSIQRQLKGEANVGTPHSFGNLKYIWKYKE